LLQLRILKAAQRLGLREREREKNQSTNAVSQSINPRKHHIESLQRFQREQKFKLPQSEKLGHWQLDKDFGVKHTHTHTSERERETKTTDKSVQENFDNLRRR
jgi:hypothetical protein